METKAETSHGATLTATSPQLPTNEVSDPEEDDLDDLDDLLDEFSATEVEEKEDAPASSGPGRPERPKVIDDTLDTTDEFSKQLQEQMASLMGEIDESPEMRQQIEAMMKELTAVADPASQVQEEKAQKGERDGGAAPSTNPEDSFQEKIRQTMERMQTSGEQATAAATEDSDDMLTQMLKDVQGAGLDGAGGEEDFSKMLMGMMAQLTNKEILYEPMKELHDKFPGWMTKNKESTKVDDLRRYEEQQRLVGEIVGRFEKPDYSDENVSDREFIVERMQKMQAAGSPPADLVGDMNAAQEALGDLDSGCPQQ